jgi:hypothetical protein
MQTLITVADLRTIFSISDDITDDRLARHLRAGSRRLRSWIGDDFYESAASDADVKTELELAEAHLAMHFALLGLNTQLRSSGLVKTERVEGDTVISYLSPAEVDQLAQQFMNAADEISRPWWTVDATVNSDLVVILERE